MKAENVARAGVSVALLAVSAQVSLAIGPVPFTLQTMVLALLPAVLDRSGACLAVAAYLLLGGIGLPVFAAFGSGIGTLAGPTGGFLWGFLLGIAAATSMLALLPRRLPELARLLISNAVMLIIAYVCGTIQLMMLMSLSVPAALAVAVIPFVIPDIIKLFIGASVGLAVARVLSRLPQAA